MSHIEFCPFCGNKEDNKVEDISNGDGYYAVSCSKCDSHGPSDSSTADNVEDYIENAIKLWNHRAY